MYAYMDSFIAIDSMYSACIASYTNYLAWVCYDGMPLVVYIVCLRSPYRSFPLNNFHCVHPMITNYFNIVVKPFKRWKH